MASTLLGMYYGILGILAIFGIHRMVLVVLYWRSRKRVAVEPAPPEEWPLVTVQLPLYNEMYVARRLIDAVCEIDYPRERLEIQVLDDSTDETRQIVADAVARQADLGVPIRHLHREDRTGFKAGALEAGLKQTKASLVAVFDADFLPSKDFLRRTVPYFSDPGIGMVQARWDHLNREFSLLTRIQAIFLDGHFVIEHTARNRSGCFFNFNGTAGIWRRQAIEQAGGWQHDTLTEDLDLSYRSQMAGWRFLYLPDLLVPAELPVEINGFKSQQYRWAKGSIQTGRKLLRRIFAADLPWRVKAEAAVHLTNNVSYLLMVVLALLVFPAMVLRRGSSIELLLLIDLPLFLAATVSVLVFYSASQIAGGRNWRRSLRWLPALMGLGIGLSLSNSAAVLSGFRQRGGEFVRTPKFSIVERADGWKPKRYRAGRSMTLLLEVVFALYFIACFAFAAWDGMWASLPFLFLFLQGYSYIVLLSLLEGFSRGGGSPPPSTQEAQMLGLTVRE
ncbi:MAG: cellulose synthase family protein [Acidobacteriota bacterium]